MRWDIVVGFSSSAKGRATCARQPCVMYLSTSGVRSGFHIEIVRRYAYCVGSVVFLHQHFIVRAVRGRLPNPISKGAGELGLTRET